MFLEVTGQDPVIDFLDGRGGRLAIGLALVTFHFLDSALLG